MTRLPRAVLALTVLLLAAPDAGAEILIRWDRDRIPPAQVLGVSTIVVPASAEHAIAGASEMGYRLLLEVDGGALARFVLPSRDAVAGVVVKGSPAETALARVRRQAAARGGRVIVLDERGKWPHIRSNWVTRNNDVLQVAGRSAQPWVENNAALIRLARAENGTPALTYGWSPLVLAETDEGPPLEHYLVAIAEAGSFGADLVLPLHPRLQEALALGDPRARADWSEIRRAIEFHGWNLPAQYQPVANVGVVAAEPLAVFEALNLMARHNLPFTVIPPGSLAAADLSAFDLLFVPEPLDPGALTTAEAFARNGGVLVLTHPPAALRGAAASAVEEEEGRARYALGSGRVVEVLQGITDPDLFAREVRQTLGRDRRAIDIWNGITVLTAPWRDASGQRALVTVLNYAAQPLPVQLRVRGEYAVIHYESPESPPVLIPFERRDGFTEFTLPAVRVGGRVFLSAD